MQHLKLENWWIGEFVVSFFDVTDRLKFVKTFGEKFVTYHWWKSALQEVPSWTNEIVLRLKTNKRWDEQKNSWKRLVENLSLTIDENLHLKRKIWLKIRFHLDRHRSFKCQHFIHALAREQLPPLKLENIIQVLTREHNSVFNLFCK